MDVPEAQDRSGRQHVLAKIDGPARVGAAADRVSNGHRSLAVITSSPVHLTLRNSFELLAIDASMAVVAPDAIISAPVIIASQSHAAIASHRIASAGLAPARAPVYIAREESSLAVQRATRVGVQPSPIPPSPLRGCRVWANPAAAEARVPSATASRECPMPPRRGSANCHRVAGVPSATALRECLQPPRCGSADNHCVAGALSNHAAASAPAASATEVAPTERRITRP